MTDLARAIVRAIAEDRNPGRPLFVLTAEQTCPEARIQRGDLVVYAQTTPKPGEAVVWSGQIGPARFGRVARSGQVRAGGRWQRPARIRGVIVAIIAPLK